AIYQALADQAQKQYDQEHRPGPEEIKKLAQSIYDNNMMAPSCASFILPPVEEIVEIISGRLSHYPTVCLILLGRRKAVSSRFVYAVLSELNQIMLSRPEMLDQYLARPDEDDDAADDMFDEIWEWREEYTQKILAENKIQEREKRPLAEVLENLDQEMAQLDPRLTLLFNPGLAEQELAGLNSNLKYPLTDDLITLYRWHNGLASYESAPLLRGNYFNPLKDALVASRQTYAASTLPRHIMTIMRHDWGWLDIDLGERPEFKGLVCQVVTDEQDQPTIYPGLSAFFGALLAVFRQGAFRVESAAGPNGEDMLIGSPNTIDRIFNRFALMDSERPEYEGDDDDTYDYSLPLPTRS
ncbi:hypothetical protein LJB99_05745, partial [Deltaproteobacteria bacterium OttesenSCG-928-K17]|nr:hypothetical protein [Deltaproteobacteria bacterium OttesenSCG-928-K17]